MKLVTAKQEKYGLYKDIVMGIGRISTYNTQHMTGYRETQLNVAYKKINNARSTGFIDLRCFSP